MSTFTASCAHCKGETKRKERRYCSNKCQLECQYREYITKWRAGLVSGCRGRKSPLLSNHLRRYLLETFGEQCSSCGWDKRHSVTGRVPLEVDHIDGNAVNNAESNLRLLCPNCHSLTPNFRNLNRGSGRAHRRTSPSVEV